MTEPDYRIRVAHHEAAHAVVARLCDFKIAAASIDVDAPSTTATGIAVIGTMDLTKIQEQALRLDYLIRNLMVILAGPASDAKLRAGRLREAMRRQSGDRNAAIAAIKRSPDVESLRELVFVMRIGMRRVQALLDEPENWAIVERVAQVALSNGGRLNPEELNCLLDTLIAGPP